jgi:hypothetical protein
VGFHYLAPVTSPDERADSKTRDAAIKQVEAALKSGRIIQADHDMRIDQLRNAQTMQDIDLQVRDLQTPAPGAPPTIAPVPPTPTGQVTPTVVQATSNQQWPVVNYGPGSSSSISTLGGTSGTGGGKAIGGIIAAIIVVAVIVPIAGAVIAFISARNTFPDFGSVGPTDDTTYLPGQAPGENGVNLFTVDGYNDLVDAIKEESNATYVYDAVLYPRYAVVELPTGTNNRYQSFYWDGENLQVQDIKSTSDDPQVDMALLDPLKMIDCVTTVRDRTDNPESWYVVYSDSFGQGAAITCYASNDFGESTYIQQTLDGTVIYDSELTVQPEPPASSG